jgi:hypothetical protein
LTSAHREFLELLVGREDVERLAAAKVLVGSDPSVKADVMASTIGDELPIQGDSRRVSTTAMIRPSFHLRPGGI